MTRGTKFTFSITGFLLAAVILSFVFRTSLLESLLRAALAYKNVPGAELTVESVTLREIAIADLSLGTASEIQIAKLALTYDPAGLAAGHIENLVLDGIRVKLDLRGGERLLGSLQFLVPEGGSESRAAPALPPVTLRDARIEALTPLGPVTGRIEGTLRANEAGAISARLQFDLQGAPGRLHGALTALRSLDGKTRASLEIADGAFALPGAELLGLGGGGSLSASGTAIETVQLDLTLGEITVPGASFEQARFSLGLTGARLKIDGEMATGDGQFKVRAKADLNDFPARPRGRIQLNAAIGAQAILWPLLAIPAPSKGRAEAILTAQGRLPPLDRLLGGGPELMSALRPDDFTGRVKLRLEDIDYLGLVKGLSGEINLTARPGPDFPGRIAADMDLALNATRVTWEDFDARKVAISQKSKLEIADEKATVTLGDKGKISATKLTYASLVAAKQTLMARIVKGTVRANLNAEAGFEMHHDVTLAPRAMSFSIARAGAARIDIETQAQKVRARGTYAQSTGYTGEVTLTGGHVTVPAYDLAAENLDATLKAAGPGEIDLAFKLGALRHTAEPPMALPIRLQGEVRKTGAALTFRVTGSGPGEFGAVVLSGRHDVAKGIGAAKIDLEPLVFAPAGVQPLDLFPALADFRNVDGTARAEADLSWTREGFAGTAALKVDDLSLESSAMRIEGLSLDLTLNQIWPPGSPVGQTLSLSALDPGVPVEDLSARFQVIAGDTPAVSIERASLRLAGGRFSLADVVLDTTGRPHHLPIQVEDLDLAEVFSLLGVEGLSGDGRLSGALPLTVTKSTPRVVGGRLTAQQPGVLRIKSDYAKDALASAGESAELLLQALENFHYENLSLTIDQPSPELATIGLSMLGNNPEVLDGYPFRLNVNLETDPRRLLKTLEEAFRISNKAIGQMWMFGR